MNTNTVVKLLNISSSTIKRWIKQYNLPLEKNELGHYIFKNEDVELLKKIKEGSAEGLTTEEIAVEIRSRRGTLKSSKNRDEVRILLDKIQEIEQNLNGKADEVVTYQLLQHRSEIEELKKTVAEQKEIIQNLSLRLETVYEHPTLPLQKENTTKRRKKKTLMSLFGS